MNEAAFAEDASGAAGRPDKPRGRPRPGGVHGPLSELPASDRPDVHAEDSHGAADESPDGSRSGTHAEDSLAGTAVDLVIAALADPTRRQILRLLAEGRPLSASSLAGGLPVTRQAVVQHLTVLQRADLVSSERSGREVLFSIQPSALEQTASWMTRLAETWSERLRLLKRIAEAAEPEERGD